MSIVLDVVVEGADEAPLDGGFALDFLNLIGDALMKAFICWAVDDFGDKGFDGNTDLGDVGFRLDFRPMRIFED